MCLHVRNKLSLESVTLVHFHAVSVSEISAVDLNYNFDSLKSCFGHEKNQSFLGPAMKITNFLCPADLLLSHIWPFKFPSILHAAGIQS